ncbi:hypothetical protein EVAR_94056_1 [Eumeta japonica]|uniref:Uncharacterized protein n=1 Tax=Eumeta variegata TaxID=151549 RepID=A0A4C1V5D6_EUMVA|nr:hypothetical protein EVAR_94056_1 [Eumeta japonica]
MFLSETERNRAPCGGARGAYLNREIPTHFHFPQSHYSCPREMRVRHDSARAAATRRAFQPLAALTDFRFTYPYLSLIALYVYGTSEQRQYSPSTISFFTLTIKKRKK